MNSNIGIFITEKRKEKNLTQKQLADLLNVTDKAVSKWERGQGYPDIMLLTPLAGALEVSVGELLQGEAAELPDEKEEAVVRKTLGYADLVVKARLLNASGIVKMAMSVLFLMGIIVCVICDIAISGAITWAVYPIASIVFTWLVFFPLLHFKKHRILISMISLTLFILPFLWVLDAQNSYNWFGYLIVPLAAVSVGYLWIAYLLWMHTKMYVWYKVSVTVILAAGLTFLIDLVLERALGEVLFSADNVISALATLLCGVLLAGVGFVLKRRKVQ